jgi:murein DD-endopeptidase MepM/ murein hydrolase activator NlpD
MNEAKMRRALSALLMITTALAGCARIDEEMGSGQRMPDMAGYRVSVDHAESLESFAERYSVSSAAIIQANHLQPPYKLQPHESLIIPPPAAYVVQSGDTVEGISNILGVDERSLANANGLQKPYHMRVGQILTVPGGIGGDVRPSHSMAENPYKAPSSEQGFSDTAPPPPRSSISAAPLPPPPGIASSSGSAPFGSPTPPPAQPVAAPAQSMPTAAPPRNVAPPPAERPTSSPTALAPVQTPAAPTAPPPQAVAALPAAPALTGGEPHFHKPVSGSVVLAFGADSAGQVNDGINIAAPAGTPVQAAEAGTVIYTGNELAGFGNLILLRHAGGWVTAYGHLATMTVQRGATVTQGQQIGTVGQTGSVSSPQVHFEIRQGSKPVDPAPLLKG